MHVPIEDVAYTGICNSVYAQKGSIRAFVMAVCMRMRGNIRAFDGNDRLHAKITSPLPIGTYIFFFEEIVSCDDLYI